MKRSVATALALAGVLAALVAANGAWAAGPAGKMLYRYAGQVVSTSGSSVTVTVQNGNRAALRSLLGQSQQQTFTVDAQTVFLKWTNGTPQRIGVGDVAANDHVTVDVRGSRGASIDAIRATPAAAVGDRGPTPVKPAEPLFLFRGVFVAGSGGTVTIDVKGGNDRALRLMIGQGARQSFSTGDATVFLRWANGVPTVIDASKLTAGDRIVIRIRAAGRSSLQAVEGTAATRVGDREPKAQEASQNAQA